jgi:hypothetical protein
MAAIPLIVVTTATSQYLQRSVPVIGGNGSRTGGRDAVTDPGTTRFPRIGRRMLGVRQSKTNHWVFPDSGRLYSSFVGLCRGQEVNDLMSSAASPSHARAAAGAELSQ